MENDIENYKCVFQIEDDGRIGGKCTYVQFIAIKRMFKLQNNYFSCWVLGKEKLNLLVAIYIYI